MERRDFIAATLTDIQTGVQAAIQNTISSTTSGVITPCWGDTVDLGPHHIHNVEFDIAVTAMETTDISAKAGISVVGVKIGGDGSDSMEASHVRHIQFSIPIIPPVTTVSRKTPAQQIPTRDA